jgi:hypothetical protein
MTEHNQEGTQTPKEAGFWEKHALVLTFFVTVILSIAVYPANVNFRITA